MNEILYILSFQIERRKYVIKFGRTKDIRARLEHHWSSFSGWELERLMVCQSLGALASENWLKKVLANKPRFKNSPEQFIIDTEDLMFLVHFPEEIIGQDEWDEVFEVAPAWRWVCIFERWGYHAEIRKSPVFTSSQLSVLATNYFPPTKDMQTGEITPERFE